MGEGGVYKVVKGKIEKESRWKLKMEKDGGMMLEVFGRKIAEEQ